MTDEELRTAVLGALRKIAPEADYARLKPEVNLRDQLDLDSIDFLNFLVELQTAVGVEIPEAEYASVATLDDCVRYLAQHAPRS